MAQTPARIRALMAATAQRIASLNALQRVRRRRLKVATIPSKPSRPARREGLDYVSLEPAEAKRQGATFVMRYLSRTPAKNLTNDERRELHAHGIDVGVVWETTADRARQGIEAGKTDAALARAQANALGFPKSTAIFFAVDFDAAGHPGIVDPYFRGVLVELGRDRTGVYGSFEVVKHLRDALGVKWLWQTYAWSRRQWDPRAQIQQYRNVDRWDYNRTTHTDAGLWLAP